MTEDQRFAATRPDVLVYKTEPLDHDVTVMGPISVDLKVSTTGTDSDFDVKLIDVYPGDYPDYNAPPAATASGPATRMCRCRPTPSTWAGISNWCAASRSAASSARASKSRCRSSRASRIGSRFGCPMSPHVSRGTPDHGADSEFVVPVDGPESAEVHGYSEGARGGFCEGHAAGLFRRRRWIEDYLESGDEFADNVAIDIGQAEISAGVAVGQLLMVDAEQVEHGGVKVVDGDGLFDGFETEVVGSAVGPCRLLSRRRP